jgi:tRNA dimethylallyltransferase
MHLLVLAGPTATGKTALAAEAAHRLGVDVLSVDSRQVYRGLDIGTGKDLGEFRKYSPPVRHHLIDIVDPAEVHSLFQYQAAFYATLDALSREAGLRGKVAVAVGGTGLYLEAVLKGYRIANVPEDAALREALDRRGREDLERELRSLHPEIASRTDMSSKKRIIRALEVAEWGRTRPVEYSRLPERPFTYEVFATRLDRVRLRKRIDRRLEERLASGMVEEVAGLLGSGLPPERLRLLGMEYREIGAYLEGRKSREAMVADLRHEIHLLAKRQETYFRGMERRGIPIRWLREGEGAEVLERSGREREGNPAGTGESRPTRVVAVAVIEDAEGRLLFLLRAPTLRASPGKWGFCGGGLEPGENPREAMEREIREEIGGEARLELEAQLDPVPGLGQAHLIVHLFKYRWLGGEVLLNAEHTRYAWIAESEFRTLDVIAGVDADLDYFGLWPGR